MPRITVNSLAAPGGILSGIGDAAKTALQVPGQLDALRIEGDQRRFNRDVTGFEVLQNLGNALGMSVGKTTKGSGSGGGGAGGAGGISAEDIFNKSAGALNAAISADASMFNFSEGGDGKSTIMKGMNDATEVMSHAAQLAQFKSQYPNIDTSTEEGLAEFQKFKLNNLAEMKQGMSESGMHPVLRDALIRQAERITKQDLSGLRLPAGAGAAGGGAKPPPTKSVKKDPLSNDFKDNYGSVELPPDNKLKPGEKDSVEGMARLQAELFNRGVQQDIEEMVKAGDLNFAAAEFAIEPFLHFLPRDASEGLQDSVTAQLDQFTDDDQKIAYLMNINRAGVRALQQEQGFRSPQLDVLSGGGTETRAQEAVLPGSERRRLGLPVERGDEAPRLLTVREQALLGLDPIEPKIGGTQLSTSKELQQAQNTRIEGPVDRRVGNLAAAMSNLGQ